ncbi:hypothetical protein ACF3NX_12630 [Acetobacter orientalis]|uniref:hypothetical protein n=1 Tax=Acetobacter orientalis TaxID=146474 RepID=UPI003866F7D5
MSDTLEIQNQTAPDIQTDITPGSETPAEQGSESPAGEGEPAVAPAQEEKKPVPAWMQRKINKMTFERREAERQAQAAREEAQQYARALKASRGEEEQAPELTPDQIRAQVEREFEQKAQQETEARSFNDRCNAIADAVKKADQNANPAELTKLLSDQAGLDFSKASHRQLLSDISELPNAGAVYYALAHDPDAASDIFDAPERRQYAMLTRFADKLAKPAQGQQATQPSAPQVSKAPPPVNAPSGAASGGRRSIYDPNISAAEFDRLWKAGVRT